MNYKRLLLFVFTVLFVYANSFAQRKKAPMYYSAYNYLYTINQNSNTTKPMPENMWQHNIDYIGQNLAPLGFNMICTDGWGEDVRNSDGFRIKHHSSWSHDFAYWANYAKGKGVKLGLYENPLWINDQIAATKGLYNPNENATWFHWLQVNNAGAEDYVRRYIEYYKSFGVDYLRVDFLSWYEDGRDKQESLTKLHGRPVQDYQKALGWLNKYCDANGVQLSLVMPHLYNHGANERTYAPGSLFRVNEDACEGKWYRFSDIDRGIHHDIWSQYWNAFDGLVFWSDLSGFDDTKYQMIPDADFIKLSSFASDDERRSILSLYLIAGSAIALTEYNIEDIQPYMSLLQNSEMFALNADGFMGKPVSSDLNNSNSQIWTGKMSNGDYIVGLFNREGSSQTRTLNFSTLGIPGNASVRDLWSHTDLGNMSSVSYSIPAHGCRVFRIKGSPCTSQTVSINAIPNKSGTDAPFTVSGSASTGLAVTYRIVSGPATISGNTVTLSGTSGTVVVRASQAGNTTYCSADADASFAVTSPQSAMYIGASFSNWTPSNLPMTLTNGIWTRTGIQLSAGNYQMKFANTGNWTGADWGNANGLIGTALLTTGGGANISFTITTAGSYTITLNNRTFEYSIISESASISVTGVTINPTTASLSVGSTQELTATVAPSNATNKSVTWSSSNTSIATVNSNGVVTAIATGNVTITATTVDQNKSASSAVTVSNNGGTPQTAMYVGGTYNSWSLKAMTKITDYDWKITGVSIGSGAQQLKFTNTSNWTGTDWGNATGLTGTATVSTGGLPNLSFTAPSSSTYTINFNTSTLQYSIAKEGYVANQSQMYVAGTISNWNLGNNKMSLTSDYTWTSGSIAISSGSHQLKFANTSNWTGTDWGNASGLNGTAKVTTGGGANISFSIATSGNYVITFNDQTLTYTIASTIKSALATTIIETKNNGSIRIFPNPVSDRLTVDLSSFGDAQIEVINLSGQTLLKEKAKSGLHSIDVKKLATKGIVIVRVTNDLQSIILKAIIE